MLEQATPPHPTPTPPNCDPLHLEDAPSRDDDALGLVQLSVLRLGVEPGEVGRVLPRRRLELVGNWANGGLELGQLGRAGLGGREVLRRVGNAAEAEVDDLGRGEGLLARLLEELVHVDGNKAVERLLCQWWRRVSWWRSAIVTRMRCGNA
jgi:hypothetical protein